MDDPARAAAAYDADDTLWLSGSGPVAGWVNTKVWGETGDAAKAGAMGATNGNGQVDEWTEPGPPAQPSKDIGSRALRVPRRSEGRHRGRLILLLEDEAGTLREHWLEPGEAHHIPVGRLHRMIAVEDCDIIEVSTPELDDVVRVDDAYGRVTVAAETRS